MERPPDSYALAWTNENGNVAMATVVFEDQVRALQWASDEHKSNGATGITVDKTRMVVTGYHGNSEVNWQLVPVWHVTAEDTGPVSTHHTESLR